MFDDDKQLNTGETSTSSPSFTLRQIGWFFAERWWIIALCVVIAGVASLIYAMRLPSIYVATAVIKLESETSKPIKLDGADDNLYRSDDIRQVKLKELQQTVQSRSLLTKVIERSNLASNSAFRAGAESLPPEKLTGLLLKKLRVQLRPGTRLIDIAGETTDAALSALIANSVARELIQQESDANRAVSRSATAFLAEEAQRLQQQLTDTDTKLQSYKDKSLSLEQSQAALNENMRNLSRQLSEAKVERIRHESEYLPARNLSGHVPKLLQIPRVAQDATVISLQASLAQQEIEFTNVQQEYKAKHPTHIQAVAKLAELNQALSNATLKVIETMRLSYESAQSREKSLTAELTEQENAIRALNTQSIPYNTLLRDREQYRALYDAVIKRMGETSMAGNLETTYLQIFQPADPPRNPAKPQRVFILATGLFIGAIVGLLLSFSWMLWDDSLKTLAEAEHFLQLPVLATIPRIKFPNKSATHIVVSNEQPSAGAQSFRALRTTLTLNDPQNQRRSYLFTSTMPNEGKTFCALNFAASLARQGSRTLIVDCDLQRPTLSRLLFGANFPSNGVTDVLCGQTASYEPTDTPNLFACSAGNPVPDVSERLSQYRLTAFLETVVQQFDRVVLDSAPIFGVSDTLLVVRDVQAVCLVVRAGATSRAAVVRAIQTLRQAGAPLSGVVLNGIPQSRMAAYGNPYYDYGYKNSKGR